jgi:hypothetical protein
MAIIKPVCRFMVLMSVLIMADLAVDLINTLTNTFKDYWSTRWLQTLCQVGGYSRAGKSAADTFVRSNHATTATILGNVVDTLGEE